MGIMDLLNNYTNQQELLNYYNATIKYKELPNEINGLVIQYKSVYIIFINKFITYYKKKKTILHELAHIELSQLEQYDKDLFAFKIDKYEDEDDEYIKKVLAKLNKEEEYERKNKKKSIPYF